MKGSKLMTMWRGAILAIGLTISSAMADEPILKNVVVNFGAGLNTEDDANNRIIRRQIEVRKGGVVNFVVSSFHQVFVYRPGIRPDDFDPNACSDTFVNQRLDQTLYQGISPIGDATPLSNAQNRVEAVFFGEPGTYLVKSASTFGLRYDGKHLWGHSCKIITSNPISSRTRATLSRTAFVMAMNDEHLARKQP